ncbi:sulfatase [Psychroserpens sp.]|uniref:sulfatase family protein n=1 Tax=Psychroserpens sp. TaxID=2020870 RepID=UPI00385F315E
MKNVIIKLMVFTIALFIFSCKEDSTQNNLNAIKDKSKPNIIFIIADDMYPFMFNNTNGNSSENSKPNLTPTIDRLVKEGVWLENMRVVSPLCTPSRYNCLTGTYASRATSRGFVNTTKRNNGQRVVQWNSFIVPGREKTMGTYFQELGYKTGFVGKNHVIDSVTKTGITVKPNFNSDPRDPKIKEILELRYNALQNDIKECGFDYADALYHNNPNWSGIKTLTSHNLDWITEKGIDFIENNKNEPFMLYFASTIPHGPKGPHKSWRSDRRITSKGILDESPNVLPQYNGTLSDEQYKKIEKDSSLERSIRNYMSIDQRLKANGIEGRDRSNLLWLDDSINALFEKLEEIDVLDNTIVVFFNDHGQELKGTLYEGGLNSEAFIWKKGGFKVGNTLDVAVSNVDFLPTLLDLVGDTKNAKNFDGYSFKAALEGEKYTERNSTYFELGYARAIVKNDIKYYAVRYPEWALYLSYEQRKNIIDKLNKEKSKFGRPLITADPMDPFGHLVMVPGGEKLERHAYSKMPHYFDLDQIYDLKNDPEEKNNLINNPRYLDIYLELKEELRMELFKLSDNFNIETNEFLE